MELGYPKNQHKRKDIVLATKAASGDFSWIRGAQNINAKVIKLAIEGSLKNLKTDFRELFQLHWPNRPNPYFCKY